MTFFYDRGAQRSGTYHPTVMSLFISFHSHSLLSIVVAVIPLVLQSFNSHVAVLNFRSRRRSAVFASLGRNYRVCELTDVMVCYVSMKNKIKCFMENLEWNVQIFYVKRIWRRPEINQKVVVCLCYCLWSIKVLDIMWNTYSLKVRFFHPPSLSSAATMRCIDLFWRLLQLQPNLWSCTNYTCIVVHHPASPSI